MARVRASAGSVVLVPAPGCAQGELSAPGCALVVVSNGAGTLDITIQPRETFGSLDAQFNLELLATGERVAAPSHAPFARAPWDDEPHAADQPRTAAVRLLPAVGPEAGAARSSSEPTAEVDFIAHIARRGDVLIAGGDWAGGPSQPAPIEGVELRILNGDLDIETQFANGRDGRWSPWLGSGAFAGTRGQARPLTGLRFRLVGRAADRFAIHGEALFLGSPVVVQSGRSVDLVGPGGFDALVGLRLHVKAASTSSDDASILGKAPRVRVFRAARS